MRTQCPNR